MTDGWGGLTAVRLAGSGGLMTSRKKQRKSVKNKK